MYVPKYHQLSEALTLYSAAICDILSLGTAVHSGISLQQHRQVIMQHIIMAMVILINKTAEWLFFVEKHDSLYFFKQYFKVPWYIEKVLGLSVGG